MTDDDLRRLAAKATPGEVTVDHDWGGYELTIHAADEADSITLAKFIESEGDADYYATIRPDVLLALLDRAQSAEAEVARLKREPAQALNDQLTESLRLANEALEHHVQRYQSAERANTIYQQDNVQLLEHNVDYRRPNVALRAALHKAVLASRDTEGVCMFCLSHANEEHAKECLITPLKVALAAMPATDERDAVIVRKLRSLIAGDDEQAHYPISLLRSLLDDKATEGGA